MVRTSLALIAATMLLSGCTVPLELFKLESSFDEKAAMSQLEAGTNTVTGSAVIRQQGGGVVSCAGSEVYLIPVTPYATERMHVVYGSDQRGYRSVGNFGFEPDLVEYHRAMRSVIGDAQGMFEFDRVKDGEYYVVTTIRWVVGYRSQGGALMQRVRIGGGETKRVVLSP